MTPNEQALIEDLFSRIRSNGVPNRDAEADALIGRQMTGTPGAAYALAQTVIVQDQALKAASARIQALEAAQQGSGQSQNSSFLGGAPQQRQGWTQQQQPPQGQAPAQQPGPWGGAPGYPPQPQADGGGGFLRGAFQTAAGVAGGALLFDGIRSLLGGGGFGGGFGGSPFGGGRPEVVEETIVNNYGDDRSDDDPSSANDPNIVNADWQPNDDDFDDGSFDDGGDDSSWA